MPEIVVYQLTQVFSQSCIIGYGEGYGQEGDEGHGSEKTQGHRLLAYVLTAEILGCEYDYPDIPDDLGLYPAKVGGSVLCYPRIASTRVLAKAAVFSKSDANGRPRNSAGSPVTGILAFSANSFRAFTPAPFQLEPPKRPRILF